MYIKETYSTSTLLREQYSDLLPHLYTIRTDFQTAGRGQAGNSWESEEGKNLLFSALLRYTDMHPAEQWRLSMLVAVSIWHTLATYFPPHATDRLTIKWPNDIYYEDKKLVGILLENILEGTKIKYSIAGIGVNVNQTIWHSDAPNPISIKQITGEEYALEDLMQQWISLIKIWETRSTEDIKTEYMAHLYRREGWHSYVEREVNLQPTSIANQEIQGQFDAQIIDITPQGQLVLRTKKHEDKTYHFKQIRFVL